jgi:hypothetical protein
VAPLREVADWARLLGLLSKASCPILRLCGVRVALRQFVEYTQQRFAGAAEAIIDPLAAAVGLDQLRGLEPREMRRDRGRTQAELVGELGRGDRYGEETLQDGRPSGAKSCLQRRSVGRWR